MRFINGSRNPIIMALTPGQVSDHIGAKIVYPALPIAKTLIGDKGYALDKFCNAHKAKQIEPCIPPRSNRKNPATYCKTVDKQRHKIENTFAKLKDWWRIATRHDHCADTFFTAITIAATVIF
jgi:transposase